MPASNDRTANGSAANCDVLPPDENMMPTGHALPLARGIQRKELVWGVVGIAVGVGLTLFILSMCAKRLK